MAHVGGPRTLPRDEPGFLNRTGEIEKVRGHFSAQADRSLIWISGRGGIGKTTLAVRLGHAFAEAFPDGVLYYELRGSVLGDQADVSDALHQFLRQLGKKSEDIPETLADRAADFLAMTADRAVLLVLDDAHTAAQVRPLLPSSRRSAVIVTSRVHLDGLVIAGFVPVELAEFDTDDATRLVGQLVDAARLDAEPDAVARLLAFCAGYPLALRVIAARIAARRHRTLGALVAQVTSAPFVHLRVDEDSPVESALDASFADLDADHKRAYCLLGWHPGSHIHAPGAAALLDRQAEDTAKLLDGLADAYLLQRMGQERYRFHPLVALHARARAEAMAAEYDINAARRRAVAWYWRRATELGKATSNRWLVGRLAGDTPAAFTGPDARAHASAELGLDEAIYRAVVGHADELGADEACAGVGEALKPWYYDTDRTGDLIAVLRVAAPAADRVGDPRLSMRLHHDLGSAHEKAGEFDAALAEFGHSGRLAESAGDPLGAASAVEGAGLVRWQQGRPEFALACIGQARQILLSATEIDPVQRERALMLLSLHSGTMLVELHRGTEAEPELRTAHAYFHGRSEKVNVARALAALAEICAEGEAITLLERAGALFAEVGLRSKQVDALIRLAELETVRGNRERGTGRLRSAQGVAAAAGLWSKVSEIDTLREVDEQ